MRWDVVQNFILLINLEYLRQFILKICLCLYLYWSLLKSNFNHPLKNSRHDARKVEHLSWQVGHVAVHEDKKRLNNTGVGGEAWSEGGQDPVDGSHQDAAQRNHQEGDDSQETIHHCYRTNTSILLKQVV